ncbi:hypothetical protein JSE7799_01170 [Jannaschia seosinensis]|uniref:DUF2383 domain-containing protein n=1 Tax=Jannaschia seosinensis TaxID=313367 RepID=A0A0M7BAU4_9RHOB|nr:PA2169 family four-helix-bundle protein [Jannaschia seosinensis]CUH36030.1 hypothetical protein JSE7799_01170 [Jannaschia seosinensis]
MTDAVKALKDLHTTLVDSRDGYHESHQRADEGDIKAMLIDLERERAMFAADLRTALSAHGEDLEEDGSILASAHRVFTNLKDRVTGAGDDAILEEIARGEKHLLDKYDTAIEAASGADSAMLQSQRTAVQAAITKVEARKAA